MAKILTSELFLQLSYSSECSTHCTARLFRWKCYVTDFRGNIYEEKRVELTGMANIGIPEQFLKKLRFGECNIVIR